VTIFRDMSGASLHRRGYRGAMHAAALNEAAAAGVLSLAGWPALCREEGAPYALRCLVACRPAGYCCARSGPLPVSGVAVGL